MANVIAPMAGSVWKVVAKENDEVKRGDVLIILESMKMEIPVEAGEDGVLVQLNVQEGDFVQEEDVIAVIQSE